MKTPASIHKYLKAIVPLSLLLAVSPTQAATYTAGNGNWSLSTNWSGSIPNGVGAVVNRTSASAATLTQDIASVTVGSVSLTGNGAFTITTGVNSFTLDNGGSGAIIENASTGASASLMFTTGLGSSFVIADDLQIKQSDANSTLSGTAASPKYAIQIAQRLVGTKNITVTNVLNDLNYGLVCLGGGTTAAGTYTGAFTLAQGAMTWTSNSAFGATSGITLGSAGGGDVSFASVLSQATVAANITVAANTGGKTVMGSIATSGTQKFTGNITLNQNLTVISQMTTADSSGVQLDGIISGTGGLQINGTVKVSNADTDTTGIVKMSGVNTFTGDTQVYKGLLLLSAASGTTSNALQYSTLNLAASDSGTVGFGSNSSTTITAAVLGGLSGSRDLALQNIATTPAAVALSVGKNNTDTTYTGALTGAGSLTKIGTGKLTLGGTNTYSGITAIKAGELTVNGSISSASSVSIGTGATLSGSGSVGGTVTGTGATINGKGLRIGATTLYGASTLSGYNLANSVTVSSGSTTLTGTTHTTGDFTVAATAILNANGTIDGNAKVNGLLSGNSRVTGNLTLTSGTLSPGNSPGITTVDGNFSMDGSSKLVAQVSGTVAGSSYDQVQVSGEVSLAGTLDLSNLGGITVGNPIVLIDNTSESATATTGFFEYVVTASGTNTVAVGATSYSFSVGTTDYLLSYAAAGTDGYANDIVLTVVPEPATWAIMLAGLGMLSFGQRLRRRG